MMGIEIQSVLHKKWEITQEAFIWITIVLSWNRLFLHCEKINRFFDELRVIKDLTEIVIGKEFHEI